MRLLGLAPLALALLLGLSCAQPPPTAGVRLDDPNSPPPPVEPDSTAPSPAQALSSNASDRRIKLTGAINEVLGFSFTIEPQTDLPSPAVRMSGFEGSAGAPSLGLAAFRIHEVIAPDLPGWHIRSIAPNRRLGKTPDVLVPVEAPRGGLRETIRAGAPCRLWIDLHVQKGTPPGRYAGAIEVAVEDRLVAAVDVELTVWPFVLPEEADFPAIAEVDHRLLIRAAHGPAISTDFWLDAPNAKGVNQSVLDTVRLLKAHGLTPVLPHLRPKVAPDARGDVQVDWTLFDALIGPMMDGSAFDDRVGVRVNFLPLEDVFAAPDLESTSSAASLLRKYVTRCVAHYKEKGWLDRSYAALPMEAAHPNATGSTRALADLLDSASAGEIRIASRLFPQNMEPFGWMGFRPFTRTEGVDVWYPPAQFFDPVKMDEERDKGREAWFSVDRPPYSGSFAIHADEASTRVLSWQASAAAVAALHLGPVNDWPQTNEAPSPELRIQHDARTLVYPGAAFGLAGSVASVRLKWLRRAMQDAAYARLLREHGLEHVVHSLSTALVGYLGADAYRTHYADGKPIGWPADARIFEMAREIMGDELARFAGGTAAERDVERFSRSAAWQRLLRETRSVRLMADGCRVRRVQSAAGANAEVNCTLSAYNDRRINLAGELRWLVDNPGIRAESGKRIEAPPGGMRRFTLTAKTTAPALSQSDATRFTFALTTSEGQSYEAKEQLTYAVASVAKTPIRIDGDLADWPPGRTNVMDGFRLISPADKDAPASRRPAAATTAFVLRDDANLYVAVQCQSPGGRGAEVSQKRVTYDDLVPRGGDLVELLFDPLNLGSRSPGDLYHIVLQRAGSDYAEKGIGLNPPVGGRQVWPVDLDVAIRRGADQWVAEVRIPLDAFGGPVPHGDFWGFNITRFDDANEEFSTWSGAVGNAYDPMSLGNLYLP